MNGKNPYEEFHKDREAALESQERTLDEAVKLLAQAITSESDEARETRDVSDVVLSRMGVKPIRKNEEKAFPEDGEDTLDQTDRMLQDALRTSGIQCRRVSLEGLWYRDAVGVMVAVLDGKEPVSLVPHGLGYAWIDPKTGKKNRVGRKNVSRFGEEGFCFYRAFPARSLHLRDILFYMARSLELKDIILIICAMVFSTGLGMLVPAANAMLFGPVLASGEASILPNALALLIGVAVAQALIGAAKSLVMDGVGTRLSRSIEAGTMARVLSLPASFFGKYSSGELSVIMGSFRSLASMLQQVVLDTALSAVFSLAYLGQIFAITPSLGVPAIIIISANLILTVSLTMVQLRVNRKSTKLIRDLCGWENGVLGSVKTIRLFGVENHAYATWASRYAASARLTYNGPLIMRLSGVISLAITLIGTIAIYGSSVASGISVSQYMAFNSAFGILLVAFQQLGGVAGTIAGIKPQLENADPIMKTQPELYGKMPSIGSPSGRIEMTDITFAYESGKKPVIDHFSLSIKPGEYLALVGASGCGKSTVMRLLLGFEQPQKGSICYDGHAVTEIDMHDLRRHIGVVLQQSQLFKGDVFSNIVISAPWLKEEDAWRAAEAAGIAEDIRKIPMGMHAIVPEGGTGFSGGQRQRIAIARALVNKPDIIMFDEATSALDNDTQQIVTDSLDALGCTRIVIAHRISTIRSCDRICMLEGGRIVEEGKYEELMAARGAFYELVKRQEA
ncbi:MAG: ATP-binding cassette domain-containing protein [Eubacterium sp.]|nr:ATP-binding cassette domain-containing protein [Eubacterium sp.]